MNKCKLIQLLSLFLILIGVSSIGFLPHYKLETPHGVQTSQGEYIAVLDMPYAFALIALGIILNILVVLKELGKK